MFLKFFSLSHNPFRTRASGTEVFAGPQLAAVTTGIQRALVERDAVCAVMGPVGAGKTVAVARGLSQLATKHVAVKIGRVRLGRDEILEELISGLGGDDTLTSTPRRIAELGRLLQAHEDQDSRVIVVVEDAVRLGLEGLIELEALTSPDTGDSSGANVILMGAPELHELLDSSELARLKQRVSGRQTVAEFSLGETQGYLAARLRAAGGNAEALFPSDAVIALHEHSGGIARVINRLGGAVLRSAADAGAQTITAALIESAAEDRPVDDRSDGGLAAPAAGREKSDAEAMPSEVGDDSPESSDDVDAENVAIVASTVEDANATENDDDGLDISEDDIPDLINDTLPEFAALKLPEGERTTADLVAELRDKTDGTQPSLPVLTPDTSNTPAAALPENDDTPQSADPVPAAEETVTPTANEAPVPEPLAQDELPPLLDAVTESPSIGADVPVPTLGGGPQPHASEPPLAPALAEDELASLADAATELPSIGADVPAPTLGREPPPDATEPPLAPALAADELASLSAAATELPSIGAETPAPTPGGEPLSASTEPPVEPTLAADELASLPDAGTDLPSTGVDAPPPPLERMSGAVEQSVEPAEAPLLDALESTGIRPVNLAPPVSNPQPPQELAPVATAEPAAPTSVDAPLSEPATPQPVTATPSADSVGTADTQTIKALDSALRPDTALMAALGHSAAPENPSSAETEDASLDTPSAPDASASLPTLSDSMRLEPESVNPAADSAAEHAPSVADKPLELAPEIDAATPAHDMPEITLDNSIRDQQEAAQARLDAEAAKREAEAQAEAEKQKPSPAEQAAAAERAAEKERLADMPSIMDQLDDNAELPSTDDSDEKDDERVKLKELADRLGGATSLEEVDDVAAETLFGVEFSQMANTVTAKALEGPSAPDETSELKLALEPEPEADLIAAPAASAAPTPPPNAAVQAVANGVNSAGAGNGTHGASAPMPPQPPEPGSLPDIESSAARRLEMVRSLNGKTGPVVPPPNTAEEIVLGEAAPTPVNDGPSPDPIEDQFGTSMTANLKALSMQNVQEMQQAEEEKEQKKRGFLSRFRRS